MSDTRHVGTMHKKTRWLLEIAVTALFVYLVNRHLTGRDLPAMLRRISPAPFGAVLLLGAAGMTLQVLRWRILLLHHGIRIGMAAAFRTVLWGNALGFVTPGRAGELFRGLAIAPDRRRDSVVISVVDRAFASGTALIVGLVCLLIQTAAFGPHPLLPRFVAAATAALALCCGAVALGLRVPRLGMNPLVNFVGDVVRALPPPRSPAARVAALCSLAAQAILLGQTALVLVMLGGVGLLHGVLIGGQAYAAMVLFPFSVANMGIREYSFGLFLGPFGARAGLSVRGVCLGASLVILLVNIILPSLTGLVWTIVEKKRSSRAGS